MIEQSPSTQVVPSAGPAPQIFQAASHSAGKEEVRQYLQFVFGVVKRRRVFLAAFILVALVVASAVISYIHPLYEATTQIVLEVARPRVGLASLQSFGGAPDLFANETEVSILTSTSLADRVIERLNLADDPFIAGDTLAPGHPVHRRFADIPPAQLNSIHATFEKNLTVRAGDRSRAIDIRFVGPTAQMASDVANTVAEEYLADQAETRHKFAANEYLWLKDQVEQLRQRVNEAQLNVEQFRRKQGVLDQSGSTVLQRQINDYNAQLTAAQVRRSDLEEKSHQLERLKKNGNTTDASVAALESASVQRLSADEALAEREVAELSSTYLSGHPKLAEAKAKLEEAHIKLRDELDRLVAATTNQAQLARNQEEMLQGKLNELNGQLQMQSDAAANLRLLEVDLKSTSELYAASLNRLREASSADERVEPPKARVISPAIPPDRAFFPNRTRMLAGAMAGAAFVGLMLAFLLEYLDAGFRSRREIEDLTDLETVASVPKLHSLRHYRRMADMPRLLTEEPVFAEAIRFTRVAMAYAPQRTQAISRILITSALPKEGKTLVSRALGVTFSLGGMKVITVDCDLRKKQTWARRSDLEHKPGLVEYLLGKAELDDIIIRDSVSGLHHIHRGAVSDNLDPTILLDSNRMHQLHAEVGERYDVVIIDTPPVKLFPDTLVLQRHVDKVLFLMRWATTRREVGLDGLRTIIQAGHLYPMVGLTQVDLGQLPNFDQAAFSTKHYAYEKPISRGS